MGELSPCLAWAGCVALAKHSGVKGPISNLPDGIFEWTFGPWEIALNGRNEENCYCGVNIPPISVWVKYNDWPAGIIDPSGGIFAAWEAANEDAFIEALEAEMGRQIMGVLGTPSPERP